MNILKKITLGLGLLVMVFTLAPLTTRAATPSQNVTGTYTWLVLGTYSHDMTLTMNPDGTFTGTGGYPAGGAPYTDPSETAELITNGVVSGNNISFTLTYTGPYSSGSTWNVTGTIAPNGSISGTSPWEWHTTSGAATPVVTNNTVVVTPSNMQGWGFLQETATGSGSIVSGPIGQPLGTGSANLVVDSTGGEVFGKAGYSGTKLSDITKLQYSTYRTSGAPALAIALQLNFDGDITDSNNTWQGRLVYEPYHTQTVNTGVWQSWNVLNDSAGTATGNWWFSNGTHATTSGCTMATPCTWSEVKTAFPNGGIHNTLGAVILKAGGSWAGGFDGNVDALTVGVNWANTTYDFDPTPIAPPIPTNKNQCKNGGWKNFTNPSFKNQGQCVSYTNHL